MLQAMKFEGMTIDERNAEFYSKMKVLVKRIVDKDFKQAGKPSSDTLIHPQKLDLNNKIGILMKMIKLMQEEQSQVVMRTSREPMNKKFYKY
ncbi:MAG: hypothetical protein EZS28_004887 [Streblomastix strix]|uniref:Uncharacterized protein n=1 Tax=Streblomastix strix TaxID=222440 RepID=A0A5J4WZF8_9EUKA|nr:MAG: hypothetical protein EZS28_004887 [Streblomastix strix]